MLVPPLTYYKELATKKAIKEKEILSNNFEDSEVEGTELELKNTAEAPLEVVEIAGNTIQNGEPSLENEVQVAGVTGNVEISSKNKNQLILEDVAETTYYGVSYSCKNGKISLNGTASQPIFIIIPLKNPIKVSKQFTWSALTNKILSTEKEVALWLSNETGSKLFNKDLWLEDTVDRVFTTTPTEETLITRIAFYVGSGFTFDNIELEIQLEYAEEASSIVEGKEQIHTISLGNKVLYGDENSRDYFNITIDQDFYEKTGYRKITNSDLVKKWKKYILDGTENIIKNQVYDNTFNLTLDINILPNGMCYCPIAKGIIYNSSALISNDNIIMTANPNRIIYKSTIFTELQDFKDYLQEKNNLGHPVYVIYQLETPETENITDETLISQLENFINNGYTYKEVTHINSDFYLKLNYRKNMYYDLENRVKALEEANNG